ncbi:MAG: hypothetical protein QNJ15_12650 [Erythrobacter sp.]|nr:hypothetical protein [Erythrobacter sp.]
MTVRDASGWQLILADLAMILFLVAIAALAEQPGDKGAKRDNVGDLRRAEESASNSVAAIDPAQALYRPGRDIPPIEQWIDSQAIDPRATLSVIALHRGEDRQEAWQRAQALADRARSRGLDVRIVLQEGRESDLYASLAFDTPR